MGEDDFYRQYFQLYGNKTTPYVGELEAYAMPSARTIGGAVGHTQFSPYGGLLNIAGGTDYNLDQKVLEPYLSSRLGLPQGIDISGMIQKTPDEYIKQAMINTPDAYARVTDSDMMGKQYEAGLVRNILGGLLDIQARKDDQDKGIFATLTYDF
jgi:hypothetical protein